MRAAPLFIAMIALLLVTAILGSVFVYQNSEEKAPEPPPPPAPVRLMHIPFSHSSSTQFKPPAEMVPILLLAANSAKNIVIRGRTDLDKECEFGRELALRRALAARDFLTAMGVPPSKIRLSYLSAGGYLADNSTPEGQAINRRVDIEFLRDK